MRQRAERRVDRGKTSRAVCLLSRRRRQKVERLLASSELVGFPSDSRAPLSVQVSQTLNFEKEG